MGLAQYNRSLVKYNMGLVQYNSSLVQYNMGLSSMSVRT